MNTSLIWQYGFNIVVNSALSFFTTAFLIGLLVSIFKVSPRLKRLLLTLPLLKLLIDPFLYDFDRWAYAHAIDPTLAETGTRFLSIHLCYPLQSGISLSLKESFTFSPADIVWTLLPAFWIKILLISMGMASLYFVALFLFEIKKSIHFTSLIIHEGQSVLHQVENGSLLRKLQKQGCQVICSDKVDSPCAFQNAIVIPRELINTFSQNELEAVIAHELAHLSWLDGPLNVSCRFISSLFWWIPTEKLHLIIENTQERACDKSIEQFQIDSSELASALVKTAKLLKKQAITSPFIPALVRKPPLANRLNALLSDKIELSQPLHSIFGVILTWIALSLTVGRLWIF